MKTLAEVTSFLTNLSDHNSLEWMNVHRSQYQEAKLWAIECYEIVAHILMSLDPALGLVDAKKSMFRINRDLRFSKDKRPYNPWFSMTISSQGKHGDVPGYYCRINSYGTITIGFGIYEISKFNREKLIHHLPERYLELEKLVFSKKLNKEFNSGIDVDDAKKKTKHPQDIFDYWKKVKHFDFTQEYGFDTTLTPGELASKITEKLSLGLPFIQLLRKLII
jgi:uncharacterized protein (TIGR02453 family)